MNLIRWEPFHELVTMRQAMDRLLEDSNTRPFGLASVFGRGIAPAVDIYETADEVVLKTPLPGVKPEQLDIKVTGNILTIKSETNGEQEIKQENYLRRECHYGALARSLTLPAGLEIDKTEASLESGILTLTIPKAEEVKPKVIKVKAKQIAEGKKVENKN